MLSMHSSRQWYGGMLNATLIVLCTGCFYGRIDETTISALWARAALPQNLCFFYKHHLALQPRKYHFGAYWKVVRGAYSRIVLSEKCQFGASRSVV